MTETPQAKLQRTQAEYPFLSFEGFEVTDTAEYLEIKYAFNLGDKITFRPYLRIVKNKYYTQPIDTASVAFKNVAFHIGLIEMISYWKAACPPQIIIKPYAISSAQAAWLKELYYNGLGEFFYLNGLNPDPKTFVDIVSEGAEMLAAVPFVPKTDGTIVPVGGGKDSSVTLEIISTQLGNVVPFILNPSPTTLNSISVAGFDECFTIQRVLDKQLLDLNAQGYFNGHTPFSAMLSFYTLLVSQATGIANVALSNESSANEPTIINTHINHQYSKSVEYEGNFRSYVAQYIGSGYNYFSFMRPLSELQIARLFARYTRYHKVFRSCNAGSKEGKWCCNCSKCLFTYTILSPFLSPEKLKDIFGENLFEKPSLLEYFSQLTGNADEKPFDCVGTIDEINMAVNMAMDIYYPGQKPFLLEHYQQNYTYAGEHGETALKAFEPLHYISSPYLELLKNEIGIN